MEFITVEQFREQPMEIQKVFLDWWKCDYGDLYYYNEYPYENCNISIIDNNLECDLNGDFKYFKSIGAIPLFTEGQLRKFIEDKTEGKIEVYIDCLFNDYAIYLNSKIDGKEDFGGIDILGENLFRAYWKVACIVAKEGLDNDSKIN